MKKIENTASTPPQYETLDLLNFILSFFVVAIHTMGGYALYPFSRIAVPAFFLISGYLFFSRLEGEQDWQCFRKFAVRNAKLYLFWFVALSPVFLPRYFSDEISQNLLKLLARVFLGSTFASSWYISAMVIDVAIVFAAKKLRLEPVMFLLGVGLYVLCCLNSNYRNAFDINSMIVRGNLLYPGTIYNSFPAGLMWISIGAWITRQKQTSIATKSILWVFVVSLVGLLGEHLMVSHMCWTVDTDCYFFLIPSCICIFLLALSSNWKIKYCKEMRCVSTLVYCMHGSIAAKLKPFFNMKSFGDSVCLFLLTMVISGTVSLLILRLEKENGLRWLRFSH